MRSGQRSCLKWKTLFLTTLVGPVLLLTGCYSAPPEEPLPTPRATAVSPASPSPPTATPPERRSPTSTFAPAPIPFPSLEPTPTWLNVGQSASSLRLEMPPTWVDLSDSLTPEMALSPLGVIALLVADSPRTGMGMLAGKEVNAGGMALALVTQVDLPPTVPIAGLGSVLARLGTAVVPLSDITTLQAGNLAGAVIDIAGMPLPNLRQTFREPRTRLLYFLAPGPNPARSVQLLFLFTAPAAQWPDLDATFTRMSQTAVLPPMHTSLSMANGALRFLSSPTQTLTQPTKFSATSLPNLPDMWLLSLEAPTYLNLAVSPLSQYLDPVVTLIDPNGQLVARLNNGYTGYSERATDIFLHLPGLYLLVITDFAALSGQYTLEIQLSGEPAFIGEGRVRFGEGVQSQLAAESRHIWRFSGTAEQFINVVVQPGSEKLDPIMNLYGPDGQRLVALDEGFSGDAEVVAGFQLPLSGEYAIHVSSFASAGGPYTLSLSEGQERTANFYDAGDLLLGQTRQETLRPREAHAWFFNGRADEEIVVRVTPRTAVLDLDVWLLDPNIERVAAQDLFMAGEAETLQYRLRESGQYLILVREFTGQAGMYEITLESAPAAIPVYAGTLSSGAGVTGSLSESQTGFWLFAGQEGEKVSLTLQPGEAGRDVVLILQAPDGSPALRVDEGGDGVAEFITDFPLPVSGQWRILLQEFYGAPVSYTLTAVWHR